MLCKYMMVYYVGTGMFFTYISEAHGTASWFDHAVCTGTEHRVRVVKSKSKTSLLATRKSWIYSNYSQ